MTGEQRATIEWLTTLGYRVRVHKFARGGVALASVPCKLSLHRMPLRIFPDGHYSPPWYDAHESHDRRNTTWHLLQSSTTQR